MRKDQKGNGDIQTWQSNWEWKARPWNGLGSTQISKGASFSIPEKKEGTCKTNEWSSVYWRKDWRPFTIK